MKIRTRVAAVLLGATALGGVGTAAQAMAPPPQCIRNCSPIEVDTTGPCYGVVIGNVELNNFCYLGPPPPK
ncbi:MAG: hypothetical protein QOI61_2053 [Actinomycetota bacterium]